MRKFLGHITENPEIHVCGYEGAHVLIQTKPGEKPRKLKMHTKYAPNDYFKLDGKRVFFKPEYV